MFKGIIFDVDGVIIDTEYIHFQAYKKVLKAYNYNLSKKMYKKHFSGKSIKGGILSFLSEVDLKYNLDLNNFIALFSREKVNNTIRLFKTQLIFNKDTLRFISEVKKGGIKLFKIGDLSINPILAISTGLEKILIQEVLRQHSLKNIFSIQVTAEKYVHSKPHPDCYRVALKEMKLKASEVFGIEDSTSGIKALKAAKIFSIGLTTSHLRSELKEANIIVKSLMSLLTK